MAVQAVARFTVEAAPGTPAWLVHGLVAEVVDGVRDRPGVALAFALWPSPTELAVHVRHRGEAFGPLDDLVLALQATLERTMTGHATLTGTGTHLVAA